MWPTVAELEGLELPSQTVWEVVGRRPLLPLSVARLNSNLALSHTNKQPVRAEDQPRQCQQPHTTSLSIQSAVALQDRLIEGYRQPEFQNKIHAAWAAAAGNEVEFLKARQELCLPLQIPVLAEFGFEASRKGVALSVAAFSRLPWSQEVEDRNHMMLHLVYPPSQNAKWIHGFDEPPAWWQRSQNGARREDRSGQSPLPHTPAESQKAQGPSPQAAPAPTKPTSLGPSSSREEPQGGAHARAPVVSIDTAIENLSLLQLCLRDSLPSVSHMRAVRPLRRRDDELYVTQFVLQSTSRNLSKFLQSEEGQLQLHPFLQPSVQGDGDCGSFGWLDDQTHIIYQTNGVARTEEPILNKSIRCERSAAPGQYIETRMLVARRRGDGAAFQFGSGLEAARSFKARTDVEANLYYTWTSCWQIYACSAPLGELGEEDTGERIFIRRSVKDFRQHHFYEFPVAKHLVESIEQETSFLIQQFSYDGCVEGEATKNDFDYQCHSLRSWQTYGGDNRLHEADVAVLLVKAARAGSVQELRRLIDESGCACDTVISEFGVFGSFRSGVYSRTSDAYAEERNALIAAVESGSEHVVDEIINLAREGRVNLNIVCHEWTPRGLGGPGLRANYTALDRAVLYHRQEIELALFKAGARLARDCEMPSRENPFEVRARQDRGEFGSTGWEKQEHSDRYADFTFEEESIEDDCFKVELTEELQQVTKLLYAELMEAGPIGSMEHNKAFKKACLRWHPDKHLVEDREKATKVFQWLQIFKNDLAQRQIWRA